jgi:hypothetical protein
MWNTNLPLQDRLSHIFMVHQKERDFTGIETGWSAKVNNYSYLS